ncbi:MAG: HupE/UreJ family protein, partial [Hymenobacter sp.]
QVAMEIQMPVPELELAFGHNISANPATLVKRLGPQLKEYILAHVHAYTTKEQPWLVELTSLQMDKANYAETNIPYWEVVAHLILKPQAGESTRKFFLEYDLIMHQVVTHTALLSLRSDWENGAIQDTTAEVGVIRWHLSDNKLQPVAINLEQGSWWKGFTSMFVLGMQHIKEGTDHLLFLLVLLLPCMLLLKGNYWGKFGGVQYSGKHLLQIVTAFTIGHSITLFISAAGWVKLPAQPVEILIAFSIFVSAVHALYPLFPGKEMYVAAGFGLIHGLAFATILANMKLGPSTLALSILGFNLGIEAMQLFIVLITVPWLILLSTTPLYKWVRIVGALLAGTAALAWVAERSTGKPNWITEAAAKTAQYGWWCIVALMVVSLLVYSFYRNRFRNPAYQ